MRIQNAGLRRTAIAGAIAGMVLLGFPSAPQAHDIPPTVVVQAFVVPKGNTLRLLLRVPLVSMRDIVFATRGVDNLDIAASRAKGDFTYGATTWLSGYIDMYEGGTLLPKPTIAAIEVSLPSDTSFTSYDAALAHVTGPPMPDSTDVTWQQAMLDVMFVYPIRSDSSRFTINAALAHLGLRTTTVIRLRPPNGAERAYEYVGDMGLMHLDPEWYQASWQFVKMGFEHILSGIDHLLFIFCLVIPFRRIRKLIPIVTAFTVAHSITLFASALGFAPSAQWFPPLIEVLIALSIVYMAFENIAGAKLQRRWMIAFGFGLVHGFGFSFALRESLQFAGSHLLTSLLSFNIGVELGQIFVLLVTIPALELAFRYWVKERIGTILLSALVADTAWRWVLDRVNTLRQYPFTWPEMDLAFLAAAMRWLMLLLIAGGLAWTASLLFRRFGATKPEEGLS